MKVYKCDKCNRQIRTPKKVMIEGKQKDPVMIMLQQIDLCEKCYSELYDFIDDYVTHKS